MGAKSIMVYVGRYWWYLYGLVPYWPSVVVNLIISCCMGKFLDIVTLNKYILGHCNTEYTIYFRKSI